MSIEGQGHFFTIYFPGFVCFVLYWAKISGERLQDHWSSGLFAQTVITLTDNGFIIEPRHEKPCLSGFRPGPTQTELYNRIRWLEA